MFFRPQKGGTNQEKKHLHPKIAEGPVLIQEVGPKGPQSESQRATVYADMEKDPVSENMKAGS